MSSKFVRPNFESKAKDWIGTTDLIGFKADTSLPATADECKDQILKYQYPIFIYYLS
jgi:hypothetical protein